jgi:2-amino-4-hydroxy-6-hydroxymethyldihydropteridine diphosphokinase
MYVKQQPAFLNMVVEGETEVMPRTLLRRLQAIERSMGRKRTTAQPNGPRVIDIDILFYGRFVVEAPPDLVVPHPRMHERRFVLEPLVEIAPELRHPVTKKSIRELLKGIEPQGVKRVGVLAAVAAEG